jgi:hypothetical protein
VETFFHLLHHGLIPDKKAINLGRLFVLANDLYLSGCLSHLADDQKDASFIAGVNYRPA